MYSWKNWTMLLWSTFLIVLKFLIRIETNPWWDTRDRHSTSWWWWWKWHYYASTAPCCGGGCPWLLWGFRIRFRRIILRNWSTKLYCLVLLFTKVAALGLFNSCMLMPSLGTTANPLSMIRASPFPFEFPFGRKGACSEDSSCCKTSGPPVILPVIRLHNVDVKYELRLNSSSAYSNRRSQSSAKMKKRPHVERYVRIIP